MNVLEKVKREFKGGVSIMEGRTKGVIECDKEYVLKDWQIMNDKVTNEDYVCYVVEGTSEFYFGGAVITDKIKRIENCLSDDEKEELKQIGLTVKFVSKKSERNRRYIDMEIQ